MCEVSGRTLLRPAVRQVEPDTQSTSTGLKISLLKHLCVAEPSAGTAAAAGGPQALAAYLCRLADSERTRP